MSTVPVRRRRAALLAVTLLTISAAGLGVLLPATAESESREQVTAAPAAVEVVGSVYEDGVEVWAVYCDPTTVNFSLEPGSRESFAPDDYALGRIQSAEVGVCYGPLGVPIDVTLEKPAAVRATSGLDDDLPQAVVEDVHLSVSNAQGLCSLQVTGSIDVGLDLKNHQIVVGESPTNLTTAETQCSDLQDGSEVRIHGIFELN